MMMTMAAAARVPLFVAIVVACVPAAVRGQYASCDVYLEEDCSGTPIGQGNIDASASCSYTGVCGEAGPRLACNCETGTAPDLSQAEGRLQCKKYFDAGCSSSPEDTFYVNLTSSLSVGCDGSGVKTSCTGTSTKAYFAQTTYANADCTGAVSKVEVLQDGSCVHQLECACEPQTPDRVECQLYGAADCSGDPFGVGEQATVHLGPFAAVCNETNACVDGFACACEEGRAAADVRSSPLSVQCERYADDDADCSSSSVGDPLNVNVSSLSVGCDGMVSTTCTNGGILKQTTHAEANCAGAVTNIDVLVDNECTAGFKCLCSPATDEFAECSLHAASDCSGTAFGTGGMELADKVACTYDGASCWDGMSCQCAPGMPPAATGELKVECTRFRNRTHCTEGFDSSDQFDVGLVVNTRGCDGAKVKTQCNQNGVLKETTFANDDCTGAITDITVLMGTSPCMEGGFICACNNPEAEYAACSLYDTPDCSSTSFGSGQMQYPDFHACTFDGSCRDGIACLCEEGNAEDYSNDDVYVECKAYEDDQCATESFATMSVRLETRQLGCDGANVETTCKGAGVLKHTTYANADCTGAVTSVEVLADGSCQDGFECLCKPASAEHATCAVYDTADCSTASIGNGVIDFNAGSSCTFDGACANGKACTCQDGTGPSYENELLTLGCQMYESADCSAGWYGNMSVDVGLTLGCTAGVDVACSAKGVMTVSRFAAADCSGTATSSTTFDGSCWQGMQCLCSKPTDYSDYTGPTCGAGAGATPADCKWWYPFGFERPLAFGVPQVMDNLFVIAECSEYGSAVTAATTIEYTTYEDITFSEVKDISQYALSALGGNNVPIVSANCGGTADCSVYAAYQNYGNGDDTCMGEPNVFSYLYVPGACGYAEQNNGAFRQSIVECASDTVNIFEFSNVNAADKATCAATTGLNPQTTLAAGAAACVNRWTVLAVDCDACATPAPVKDDLVKVQFGASLPDDATAGSDAVNVLRADIANVLASELEWPASDISVDVQFPAAARLRRALLAIDVTIVATIATSSPAAANTLAADASGSSTLTAALTAALTDLDADISGGVTVTTDLGPTPAPVAGGGPGPAPGQTPAPVGGGGASVAAALVALALGPVVGLLQ